MGTPGHKGENWSIFLVCLDRQWHACGMGLGTSVKGKCMSTHTTKKLRCGEELRHRGLTGRSRERSKGLKPTAEGTITRPDRHELVSRNTRERRNRL